MTSCKSSGSMRPASVVEPTRSENITVTWRRSCAEARFQTIHHYAVDVARGLALLFGIDTEALPEWDAVGRCVSSKAIVLDRDLELVALKENPVHPNPLIWGRIFPRGRSGTVLRLSVYRMICGSRLLMVPLGGGLKIHRPASKRWPA